MTTAIKGAAPADISSMESVAKALRLRGYLNQDRRGLFFCATVTCKHSSGVKKEIYRWLDDDGDSQRLAVALGLLVDIGRQHALRGQPFVEVRGYESRRALALVIAVDNGESLAAATRRAIFLAAAAIGEAMP